MSKIYEDVLVKLGVKQTPEFTARVLSYEVGDIHKLLIYKERFGTCGYLGDLRAACADTLSMICLLSEQLGYDINELTNEGLERFEYRIKEIAHHV